MESKALPDDVKVPVSNQDMGGEVVNKERWEELRRLWEAGMSVSGIARQLDLDRKTVRSALKKPNWTPYQRETAAATTLLSPHEDWLRERAPQVHYSARILYQELRSQRGFTGSYDTVRKTIQPWRGQASVASLTQRRFETEPGQQAQVDWGQIKVRFAHGPAEVHIFVMTLGYSRRAYVEGFENERLTSLLAAHEHAFAWFGGRCAEILYDRMRTVVLGTSEGKPRWNPTFDAFARHWGFEPRLCRPYRAQTKGKVESGVKYVKRNFAPGRIFQDIDDFNEQLRQWLVEIADVRLHGTTHERPIDRFAAEAAALTATSSQAGFLDAMVRDRVVALDWLISIDTNRYSVPCRLIGKTVQVLRSGNIWQIRYQNKLVAEHAVLAGRYQLSVQPGHGPGAVARNARQRFAPASEPTTQPVLPVDAVEVRDLQVYEQMLEVA
ncbi:IS21 family transposase [Noviherbaspirillum malthae]|jgi:transposase|uniref:IS21 family transposase n=1 Tax=Noviherbaspirillum malthae TaxID=1260987 RepID=UPI001E291E5B|nr:IS21 family transposase [Noviherbaspirillum malthae]